MSKNFSIPTELNVVNYLTNKRSSLVSDLAKHQDAYDKLTALMGKKWDYLGESTSDDVRKLNLDLSKMTKIDGIASYDDNYLITPTEGDAYKVYSVVENTNFSRRIRQLFK